MTISEIAKLAGVSNTAVSRYLNHGYLSAEKREAIARVIAETGYRPSVQAQVLRTGKTKTIGIILPKLDSYSISNVVSGIIGVLEEKGYHTLLVDTFNDPAKELESLDTLHEQRVDGVILIATVFTPQHHTALQNCTVPVVIVGQQFGGYSCVYHDDYNAIYTLTQLVLQKGCRRLGYLGARMDDRAVGQERHRAYCDAVKAAGLEEQAGHTCIANFSIESGEEQARRLWEAYGPLDAILCATSRMAVGALQYLRSIGKRVPEDVMLTGQGDSTLCRVCTPSITSVRYAYEESGRIAAEMLLEKLNDPSLVAREIKLSCTLVERESTQRKYSNSTF